ncbi:MAG: PQQ-binding-like beta-propeller repeat protein, partial [Bryobacteraceae bacterium]
MSAQAARRGIKVKKNSADLAAPRESVVRQFPMSLRNQALLLGLGLLASAALYSGEKGRSPSSSNYRQWKIYGGGPENIRYSALDQINRHNVRDLKVAWTFDTGDATADSEMQCNPIVIDGILFATTPKLRVIALDAATGRLRWSFDPNEGRKTVGKARNRGLAYWESGSDRRIYVTARQYLYALDARTGKPVPGFGEAGRVDMREGLGRDAKDLSVSATTPGVVYKDLLIMGSSVGEGLPSAPGDIRAYDVRTGRIRWTFHTIPHPGEFGYETWPKEAWTYAGGANNWAGMTVDEERGLVFVPTGSAAFDFYGANRVGDNLFANSLIALKAGTGERVWHFQAVKHDVWDRDFPAPPNLVKVKRDGREVAAVAQITKSGHVFLFDRDDGDPLFPIEYRKVPQSAVEGEVLAETQPLPLKPPAFARQEFTEQMVTRRTPEAHQAVLKRLRQVQSDGQFAPPSLEGTVIFPGFDGAGEWGGAAFDPDSGLLYVNSNEMPWVLRLVEKPEVRGRLSGRDLYRRNCANCHGADLLGNPPEFPPLVRLDEKYSGSEVAAIVRTGAGRMPGFAHLENQGIRAVVQYIMSGKDVAVAAEVKTKSPIDLKYTHDGYNKFLDPDGYPAVEPPW